MRSSRTVSTTTPSPRGRRLSSSTRTPTGSRRRSTTSRTANAGSRVARRPLSSRLPLLLLALVAACATAPPREPVGEAARALTLLADRASEFTDLRALADIDIKKGRERQRLRGALLVKAPSSIRFEALSPFGPPLLVVTIHEGRLTAYDAVKNEAYVGPANAETASRVLGLPLSPEDLVAALAGRVAPPHDLRSAELLSSDDAGPSLSLVASCAAMRPRSTWRWRCSGGATTVTTKSPRSCRPWIFQIAWCSRTRMSSSFAPPLSMSRRTGPTWRSRQRRRCGRWRGRAAGRGSRWRNEFPWPPASVAGRRTPRLYSWG